MKVQGRFSHSLRVLHSSTSESVGLPTELRAPEEDAQSLLLVRAVEEADREGELVSQAERLRATEASQPESGFATFVVQRARILRESIEDRTPRLARMRRAASMRIGLLWIAAPALLFGLASNLLGPDKHINVVANPLAGLILWNLAVYLLLALGVLRRAGSRPAAAIAGTEGHGFAGSLVAWRARLLAGRAGPAANAGAAYAQAWVACALPLLGARLRRTLHLGAAVLVSGALAGMYARGLLFEYLPTWESTFLGPAQVDGWLALLLGPASMVSGIAVPSVERIGQPGAPNAADWIHLYALMTVALVLAPRLLLTMGATRQARRLANELTVDTSARYYRQVFASGHGGDLGVDVQPYSYTLTPARADTLKSVLHDVLGARAHIVVAPTLEYGEGRSPDPDPQEMRAERATVMLFNLAQTPETEVHGRLLTELRGSADRGGSCLVLIDAAGWRERAGEPSASERRLDERRRTWDRVVRDAGLTAVHVNLDLPPGAELLEGIERGFWPARDVGVAS